MTHTPHIVHKAAAIGRLRLDCGTRLILGKFVFDHRPPLGLRADGENPNDPDRLATICRVCNRQTPRDIKEIARANCPPPRRTCTSPCAAPPVSCAKRDMPCARAMSPMAATSGAISPLSMSGTQISCDGLGAIQRLALSLSGRAITPPKASVVDLWSFRHRVKMPGRSC
jgi:hypothetical protein